MLVQLIYSSHASKDFSEHELVQILQTSVRNNQAQEISGLLLYYQGQFMQLLEGQAAAVDATFERIRHDRRHYAVEAHLRTPADEREFPAWHMGFRHLSQSDALALPNYAPILENGFDGSRLTQAPQEGLAILKAIAGLPD